MGLCPRTPCPHHFLPVCQMFGVTTLRACLECLPVLIRGAELPGWALCPHQGCADCGQGLGAAVHPHLQGVACRCRGCFVPAVPGSRTVGFWKHGILGPHKTAPQRSQQLYVQWPQTGDDSPVFSKVKKQSGLHPHGGHGPGQSHEIVVLVQLGRLRRALMLSEEDTPERHDEHVWLSGTRREDGKGTP